MSTPQTNFENNNRMSELTKNINDIFGYVLLYSVIIFTALSALLGGIVVYPVYGVIYIFNKIREHCCANEVEESAAQNEIPVEIVPEKKPIIDENWCNVSVKNIINFENEVTNEVEEEVNLEAEADVNLEEEEDVNLEEEDVNLEEADVNLEEAVVNLEEAVVNLAVVNLEEVLSIRRPSEEELREFQKEEDEADASEADASEADASSEVDDYSPKDKYSIGHYKSKTYINDPLDFDN
jgi:hypothetical protein